MAIAMDCTVSDAQLCISTCARSCWRWFTSDSNATTLLSVSQCAFTDSVAESSATSPGEAPWATVASAGGLSRASGLEGADWQAAAPTRAAAASA